SANNTLNYGVEWVLNKVGSQGMLTDISTNTQMAGPSRYPQSTWQSYAIYINDRQDLGDVFTLQASLRYSQFVLDAAFDTTFYPFPFTEASLDNGAMTGSLGAIFHPSESFVISTNLGTAFRAPNVDDVGKVFDSEPGAVTVPNPDLDAEY